MLGQWTLELQSFRDYSGRVVLKDESGTQLLLAGWFVKYEIVHDDGSIIWSTDTSHVQIELEVLTGKSTIILNVPKAEIVALPFDWAVFKFYASADPANPDLLYEGKVKRI